MLRLAFFQAFFYLLFYGYAFVFIAVWVIYSGGNKRTVAYR
jgi:hypothetical protein